MPPVPQEGPLTRPGATNAGRDTFFLPRVAPTLVLKYNIRAVRVLGSARSDLAGLDEVVEGGAGDARGCAAADRALCRALQHGAVAQRDRIRDAGGHAGRTKGTDSRRARPQAGAGTRATSAAPSPGGLTFRVTMALPGETEAGSAGKQPCRGIARRAHRDDDHGRGSHLSRSSQTPIGSIDPDALKIPARRAASTLTRSVRSPVLAEPAHCRKQFVFQCASVLVAGSSTSMGGICQR